MANQKQVELTHPDLPNQTMIVEESKVHIHALSGWVRKKAPKTPKKGNGDGEN